MNEQTRAFVHEFNEKRDFFECHELFEAAWKAESEEPLKSFYKAMVQVATAQFKINQGFMSGFRKLYGFCFGVLEALPDVYQGIRIDALRRDFTAQLNRLPDQDKIEAGSYKQYNLDFLMLELAE